MEQSQTTKEIFTALANAQAEMRAAPKDTVNPHFNKRYADLTSIWDAIREPLTKNGLSVVQSVMHVERGIAVQTQINHKSGEWIRMDACPIPLDKSNAQGAGSAITYGKRYSLAAAVGIVADEDDDGNAASQGQQKKPQGNSKKPPSEPPVELTQKDRTAIATYAQEFAVIASGEDFDKLCECIAKPDSVASKADHPEQVKAEIKATIQDHKFHPKNRRKAEAGHGSAA